MSYQNIPGYSSKFERDCQQRWEMIKAELPSEGVVMDIGAAEGYFLKQIAEQTPLLAVGVEKKKERTAFQYRWLNKKYNGKIVSCHFGFGTDFSRLLARTPEWFDCILLLSTLHWINSDEFLKNISSMAGKVIVEIPDLNDNQSTGQKFLNRVRKIGCEKKYLSNVTKRQVRLLGVARAHTYPTRNVWVIEGDLERRPEIPHINFQGKSKCNYYQKFCKGKLNCRITKGNRLQEDWIAGVNLATLAAMNITFPSQIWWEKQIQQSIDELKNQSIKGDMRIHNIIVSRDKLNWIDLDHHNEKCTIFEDIKDLVKGS